MGSLEIFKFQDVKLSKNYIKLEFFKSHNLGIGNTEQLRPLGGNTPIVESEIRVDEWKNYYMNPLIIL